MINKKLTSRLFPARLPQYKGSRCNHVKIWHSYEQIPSRTFLNLCLSSSILWTIQLLRICKTQLSTLYSTLVTTFYRDTLIKDMSVPRRRY